MPKYYCDYCKSYLTHDTMSVRRSHLMGRTHIRLYCDYYEAKAKETGIWNPDDMDYEVRLDYLSRGAPGSEPVPKHESAGVIWEGNDESVFAEEGLKVMQLPPPPNLSGFPNPPPSVLRTVEESQRAVFAHQKKEDE
ncbi:zf-U1-domain-containing protein [Suhomyces tanzawaensis NRRL Y-17324]|uniref:Zf-U1-domain-containing protein n=1 Tax=Suhomyces tanzawaensis NRRL Y-17324 TaxID=984487 RepID=A0A1E4SMH3_9ASCO|nr:zf-U1-domain-containing protein [Suhomyces tanzawaensis NRRL Y-17324]ODV80688.1 zf-U1-domain-containing protein [Suhomyces tanzawaensis NRRL Y-17324]